MSDERLRELERRWRDGGSIDEEVAYLRERVRVGDLEPARVGLAAYCGHEAAQRMSEPFPEEPLLKNWVYRLHSLFGTPAVDRVALTVGRLLLPLWVANVPGDRRVQAALDAARERVRESSAITDANAREAANAAGDAAEAIRSAAPARLVGPQRVMDTPNASPGEILHRVALAARNAALPATGLPVHVATSAAQAAGILGETQVRSALCKALRAWALSGESTD